MPLKVLYLDDEPDLCDIFTEEFTTPGIIITAFSDPKEAMASLNTNPPDLIFLDYRLPGTNGDKLALAMPPHIPKYLITGESTVETKYPFLAILGKPFDRSAIQEIMITLLKSKGTK